MSNSKKSARDKIHQKGEIPIKVSVLMMTYNHEEFINQAVESVLDQETDFDYELVIGEDFSSDRTRELLIELQEQNPNKIRLLQSERNLGPIPNFMRTLRECQGQYLAILEGDDYWIWNKKLQKQVEFMDCHSECTICFTNANIVNEDGSQILREYLWFTPNEISTQEDFVVRGNFIPNCTVLYRRDIVNQIPEWFCERYVADNLLHFFNAQFGDIGYVPTKTASYRRHEGGIFTGASLIKKLQVAIADYETYNVISNNRYEHIIRPIRNRRWMILSNKLVDEGIKLGNDDINIKSVSRIFRDWPEWFTLSNSYKANITGKIYESLLFDQYFKDREGNTRYCFLMLFRLAPKRMINRGIWSIALKIFVTIPIKNLFTKIIAK